MTNNKKVCLEDDEFLSVAQSKKSIQELQQEVNGLIDLALKGNKEAAKLATKLSKAILRKQGIER